MRSSSICWSGIRPLPLPGTRRFEAGALAYRCPHPAAAPPILDKTIVTRMNHESIVGDERVVSASCTTITIIDPRHPRKPSASSAPTTTLHSVMNDQPPIGRLPPALTPLGDCSR